MASSEDKKMDLSPSSSSTALTLIAAVSIKLPEFYQADPLSWFLQAEAQFGIWGITKDKTKFWHILSTLDAETSACAAQVISPAKAGEKYTELQDSLLKAFCLSCWEHADRILSTTELRDQKPSALMNCLLMTLGEFIPEIFLQHVFLHTSCPRFSHCH